MATKPKKPAPKKPTPSRGVAASHRAMATLMQGKVSNSGSKSSGGKK